MFINSMLCLPLFSDAWLNRLKLSAAEAEEVIYKQTNKQTNNQSFKQSHCNKCVSKPSWGLECVLA
jgi:hypothetical protein